MPEIPLSRRTIIELHLTLLWFFILSQICTHRVHFERFKLISIFSQLIVFFRAFQSDFNLFSLLLVQMGSRCSNEMFIADFRLKKQWERCWEYSRSRTSISFRRSRSSASFASFCFLRASTSILFSLSLLRSTVNTLSLSILSSHGIVTPLDGTLSGRYRTAMRKTIKVRMHSHSFPYIWIPSWEHAYYERDQSSLRHE